MVPGIKPSKIWKYFRLPEDIWNNLELSHNSRFTIFQVMQLLRESEKLHTSSDCVKAVATYKYYGQFFIIDHPSQKVRKSRIENAAKMKVPVLCEWPCHSTSKLNGLYHPAALANCLQAATPIQIQWRPLQQNPGSQ
jgi:hypothetical protein